MFRVTRRRAFSGVVFSVAMALVVVGTSTVSAQDSRASNRWNHVAGPPTSTSVSPGNASTEPAIRGQVWKELHLVEVFGKRFTFVDVAPKGDSPGDYGVFKDVVATTGGVKVGTIDAQCIASYSDQCWGSIRLPGRGQITFAGINPVGVDPDHFAVTGGTGEFVGVGGVLLIQFPFIDAAKLTVTLTL